jgi:hypothetical protein
VYAVDDDGRWEVAFGDRCPAFAVADRDRASACLHLPPGCYAVVPTLHEKEAGLSVNFRIAFAAQQEVEVEALSRLEVSATAAAHVHSAFRFLSGFP